MVWTLLVALLGGSVQVAGAATPTLSVSPTVGRPDTRVVATGAGFPRSTAIVLTWDGSTSGMPAVRTRLDGSFRVRLAIPADASPGGHTLEASAGGVQATTTVTVTSAAVPGATATSVPPAPTATVTQGPAPTHTPTAVLTPADSSYGGRLLALVNDARSREGLGPLSTSGALNRAAKSYDEKKSDRHCISTTSPAGARPGAPR